MRNFSANDANVCCSLKLLCGLRSLQTEITFLKGDFSQHRSLHSHIYEASRSVRYTSSFSDMRYCVQVKMV
jgi:hypothetical protein